MWLRTWPSEVMRRVARRWRLWAVKWWVTQGLIVGLDLDLDEGKGEVEG